MKAYERTLVSCLLSLVLLVPGVAWSTIISDTDAGSLDGADVGSIDTFIAVTNALANSNSTSELNWVNEVLAPTTVTFSLKEEENVPYYDTNVSGVFAYYLDTPPVTEYFILKNAKYWALFANLGEMSWAVFDSTYLPDKMNLSGGEYTISHVSRFDTETNVVPEPSTLLLLGAGLAGIAIYRRKKS